MVNTIVYFPYDMTNVYDGGESVNFSDGSFHGKLAFKISKSDPTEELLERIGEDMKFLNMFDDMHSLDPFLFKTKAEQLEMDSQIHPAYFAIRMRMGKNQTADPGKDFKTGQRGARWHGRRHRQSRPSAICRTLSDEIWEARDVEGIEPFIHAMQIQPENAPEVFFVWKAVCYYQVRYNDMLNSLKALFQWVGHNNCAVR